MATNNDDTTSNPSTPPNSSSGAGDGGEGAPSGQGQDPYGSYTWARKQVKDAYNKYLGRDLSEEEYGMTLGKGWNMNTLQSSLNYIQNSPEAHAYANRPKPSNEPGPSAPPPAPPEAPRATGSPVTATGQIAPQAPTMTAAPPAVAAKNGAVPDEARYVKPVDLGTVPRYNPMQFDPRYLHGSVAPVGPQPQQPGVPVNPWGPGNAPGHVFTTPTGEMGMTNGMPPIPAGGTGGSMEGGGFMGGLPRGMQEEPPSSLMPSSGGFILPPKGSADPNDPSGGRGFAPSGNVYTPPGQTPYQFGGGQGIVAGEPGPSKLGQPAGQSFPIPQDPGMPQGPVSNSQAYGQTFDQFRAPNQQGMNNQQSALMSSILQNPETLNPAVLAQMKAGAKGDSLLMQQQLQQGRDQADVARGTLGGGAAQGYKSNLENATVGSLLNSNRDLDVKAATQNRADQLGALNASEALQQGQLGRATSAYQTKLGGQQAAANTNLATQQAQAGENYKANQSQVDRLMQQFGINSGVAQNAQGNYSSDLQTELGRNSMMLDVLKFMENQRQFNGTLGYNYNALDQSGMTPLIQWMMQQTK